MELRVTAVELKVNNPAIAPLEQEISLPRKSPER